MKLSEEGTLRLELKQEYVNFRNLTSESANP